MADYLSSIFIIAQLDSKKMMAELNTRNYTARKLTDTVHAHRQLPPSTQPSGLCADARAR